MQQRVVDQRKILCNFFHKFFEISERIATIQKCPMVTQILPLLNGFLTGCRNESDRTRDRITAPDG